MRQSTMKLTWRRLSQRYGEALRRHLKQDPATSLRSAGGWGRQAVARGVETLDVARMHAAALAMLEISGNRNGIEKRAEKFFAEAIIPIENTHEAARKSRGRLGRLKERLDRRTVELAVSNRSLQE